MNWGPPLSYFMDFSFVNRFCLSELFSKTGNGSGSIFRNRKWSQRDRETEAESLREGDQFSFRLSPTVFRRSASLRYFPNSFLAHFSTLQPKKKEHKERRPTFHAPTRSLASVENLLNLYLTLGVYQLLPRGRFEGIFVIVSHVRGKAKRTRQSRPFRGLDGDEGVSKQ